MEVVNLVYYIFQRFDHIILIDIITVQGSVKRSSLGCVNLGKENLRSQCLYSMKGHANSLTVNHITWGMSAVELSPLLPVQIQMDHFTSLWMCP